MAGGGLNKICELQNELLNPTSRADAESSTLPYVLERDHSRQSPTGELRPRQITNADVFDTSGERHM
jgi:hypothetical protein